MSFLPWDVFDQSFEMALNKMRQSLPTPQRELLEGVLAASRLSSTEREEVLRRLHRNLDNPLSVLNLDYQRLTRPYESRFITTLPKPEKIIAAARNIVVAGEWLAKQRYGDPDWPDNLAFISVSTRLYRGHHVMEPSDWCFEPHNQIGCPPFDTPVGRVAAVSALERTGNWPEPFPFRRLEEYLGMQSLMDDRLKGAHDNELFARDDLFWLYLLTWLNLDIRQDENDESGAQRPTAQYLVPFPNERKDFSPGLQLAFECMDEAFAWQNQESIRRGYRFREPEFTFETPCRLYAWSAGQPSVLPVLPHSVCAATEPLAVAAAWDTADRNRFAVWWVSDRGQRAMNPDLPQDVEPRWVNEPMSVIQIYTFDQNSFHLSHEDGVPTQLGMATMGEDFWTECLPISADPEDNARRMYLCGNTVRFIHQGGLRQMQRKLQSEEKVQGLESAALDPLSGELTTWWERPQVIPYFHRDLALMEEFGIKGTELALQHHPAPEWRPVQASAPQNGCPFPTFSTGSKRTPDWWTGTPRSIPEPAGNGESPSFDLHELRTALSAEGWVFDSAFTATWRSSLATFTAQLLDSSEGLVVLFSAYRDSWPSRWKVKVHGAVQEAVNHLRDQLRALPQLLLCEPPPVSAELSIEPPFFDLDTQELQGLVNEGPSEEAAFAQVVIWIRAYLFSHALQLPAPPAPDWNVLRLMWIQNQIPKHWIRCVWEGLPEFVQEEIEDDLNGS